MKNGEIKALLKDYQAHHSQFQIDNFIVGKAGDDWARYKQALREIASRKNALETMREQLELDAYGPPLWRLPVLWLRPKRVRQIHAQRRRRARDQGLAEVAEIERELAQFVKLASALRKQLGELTPDRRRELEARSWFKKARQMVLIDSIVNGGRPSERTVDFILGLPIEMQNKILVDFNNGQLGAIANGTRRET